MSTGDGSPREKRMPLQPTVTSFSISIALALAAVATLAVPLPGAAQPATRGYDRPPQNILDVMHAPSPPVPSVSPARDTLLLVTWQDYPTMARVATPFLRLAGARVEPKNHSRHDTPGGYGITPCAASYELVRIADKLHRPVALPAGACPDTPMWAADGKRFAFTIATADSVELWIGDAANATARRVPGVRLNPMLGHELQWMADQKTLLVKLVPGGIGAPPAAPRVPAGPSIQETSSGKGQSSTYETRDTLNSKHDEDLFDYYAASQLAFVYDDYLDQLVADAKAAVDEAVRLGGADPQRVGVTGHSHGALMTVNLLAHSDLFRAGVATSGSYNKTLTPFGFQSERRSVWNAPDVYRKVSPFFVADKLKTPLLIVHGADDADPGTTPLQATKLYEAVRGNGGTARLVMLPHEPHWYSAIESNEQVVYEMVRWFDTYVKNAPARSAVAAPG